MGSALDAAACGCAMPANAISGRRYSGINVLILWAAWSEGGYALPALAHLQASASSRRPYPQGEAHLSEASS